MTELDWPEGVPTPARILAQAPAVTRLCARYREAHVRMVERSRRQRIGLGLVVVGVGVGSVLLGRGATTSTAVVAHTVLAVAAVAVVALGILSALWTRDTNRLQARQGERLLRALSVGHGLHPDEVAAITAASRPVRLFLGCYATWRAQAPPGTAPAHLTELAA